MKGLQGNYNVHIYLYGLFHTKHDYIYALRLSKAKVFVASQLYPSPMNECKIKISWGYIIWYIEFISHVN